MVNPLAAELENDRRAPPCSLIIFGATGDLTKRKLVPSLAGLHCDGLLPTNFSVVGFARRDKSDEDFRNDLRDGMDKHGRQGSQDSFKAMESSIFYHRSTFEDPEGYATLSRRLDQIELESGTHGNRIFYLATPPSAYSGILKNLKDSGLSKEASGRFSRVIVEKPFGCDRKTAEALNAQVAASFDEDQVYRIDHYLGKETVQNILAMRFAIGIYEPLWNQNYIDHVQLTVAESIGVGSRGRYFEEAGIIRDMIQNHLLQVLTLVAMEPPVSLAANAVRDEKVKVLHAIRTFKPQKVPQNVVRGRYIRDFVGGEEVPGYLEEEGVPADSMTETYAAIRLQVNNWRWGKTPFFLRSGKRLPRRVSEVAIHFKRPPLHLFHENELSQNILLLRIQPDEGVSLRFGSKVPGPEINIRNVRMDFRYGSAFGRGSPDAYERLLLDAMLGDSTLFARRDEVDEAWRIVDSIIAGWGDCHPQQYGAGTWGPESADQLLGRGRIWRKP